MMDGGEIDFVIDIPASRFSTNEKTNGYMMRQAALSNAIPLITNIKNARLTIASLSLYHSKGKEFNKKFEFEPWVSYAQQNSTSLTGKNPRGRNTPFLGAVALGSPRMKGF